MIVFFHTPAGQVAVDPLIVTDGQLSALGLTRDDIAPFVQEAQDSLRANELLATSPAVITMPEIWEILRILGRIHGLTP